MKGMESWSWPPRYDNSYRPAQNSRYWFPVRETMDAGERDKAIVLRLREVCDYAYTSCTFYRNKWDEAGFHPSQLRSLEDFERRCPVVVKADLREAQHRAPPFGDYLCVSESEIHHIHGTSGTTGRPTAFAIGRDDWQNIANAHARVMWGMGIRPGDIVFVAAIFSLYMGSWGALCGAERLGAKAFPFGAGAPGMSSRALLWLGMMKPKAFYSTPSYALYLAETAVREGLNVADFGIERMFFSGEPGASVPGVRDRIIEAYRARVFDCGSMAEMSPFMNVAASAESASGMLCWQDVCYTEVCDPKTFERVPYGQRGTPVYTHLERTSQPMIRLVSGDLALWTHDKTACGRTYPSLPQGIFGRIDDMITIRGENVYPSEIDAALNKLAHYGGEHRIVVSRAGQMDELLLQVEASAELGARGAAAMEAFRMEVAGSVQSMLGLRTLVEVVAPGTYPRTDFKARRVIDDRDVFKEMAERLTSRPR
jgi:phenylacetate-CoA ligase